ncbi:MAG: T9SS type A sorting domain-containing protein [Paludibacteraceae bacterium]|nr:T9SS type A sorting domain-containing protein [Paludibacteraceae bacterium]
MRRLLVSLVSLLVTTSMQAESLIGIRADKSEAVFAIDDVMSIKVSEADMMTVNKVNGEKSSNFSVVKFGKDEVLVGVDETKSVMDIKVYPNPVKKIIYLVGADASTSISIVDINGKTVFDGVGESIDVEHLAKGMYVISAEGKRVKFIKE